MTYKVVGLTLKQWAVVLSCMGKTDLMEGKTGTKAGNKLHKEIKAVERMIFTQIR